MAAKEKLKRKTPVPVVETKKIWRDDAIIYPDGTREGAWVQCSVYQAEKVPETRYGFVRGTAKKELSQAGVERLADLYYRLVERDVLEGKGVDIGDEDTKGVKGISNVMAHPLKKE
jgi:hypothetical protein